MPTIELPPEASSPGAARRFVREVLAERGVGGTTLQDAELLVTELVTNAVVHAATPLVVELTWVDEGVRISVTDQSQRLPEQRPVTPRSIAARGLHIIQALAESWTVRRRDDGKVVEVVLAVSPDE